MDQLVVSKQQARTRDVERDLEDLVDNIRVHGQLEPIIVAPLAGEEKKYEIIAGQRRWLAMQRLNEPTIMAAILTEEADEATARVLSVSENIIRRDLNSNDLIDVCTALYRKYGSTKAVAEELGLPYNKVRNYVKFERLRPELKSLVESGELDIKAAIRVEDLYRGKRTDEAELRKTAGDISGMTNAQQADYFHRAKGTGNGAQAKNGLSPASSTGKPGEVRQILVTLRSDDHQKLRDWATSKGLGQDKAAAWIINGFLKRFGED